MATIHPMVNIAVKAARRAGRIINQASGNLDVLTVRHKSLNDLVSEVDRAAEAAIIDTLRTAYPEHAILAEESGAAGQSEYVWIIDPLDGTTNFLHGFPQYCVSIALVHKGVITQASSTTRPQRPLYRLARPRCLPQRQALARDPARQADRRARRYRISLPHVRLPRCLCQHAKDFMTKTAGVRRPGSAALDLARWPQGVWMDSGRSAWRPGIWQRAPADHRSRRAGRRSRGERRVSSRREHRRRQRQNLRADAAVDSASPFARAANSEAVIRDW